MDTHEFQFPGGSAVITTTTGGTREAPDFCVSVPDASEFAGNASVFAAEILKLAGRVEELETALAAAGEERENMEIRLSGRIAELEATFLDSGLRYSRQIQELSEEVNSRGARIDKLEEQLTEMGMDNSLLTQAALDTVHEAETLEKRVRELEAEVERRAAENVAVQDKSRSVTETLLAVAALFKGTPEAKIEKLRTDLAAALKTEEELRAGVAAELKEKRGCLKDNERLRADLAAAIKTGEEQAQRLRHDSVVMAQLDENIKQLRRQVRDAVADATFDRLSRLDVLLSSEEPPEELLARFGEGKTAPFVAWRWFRDFLRGPIDDPVPEVPRETDDAEEPPAAVTIGEVEEWRRRIARHGAGISDLDASDKPNLEISVTAREIPKQPTTDAAGERKRLEEEIAALLEILRSLEWIGPDADAEASAIWCPACDNLKEEGHTEDCRLGRALEGKAVHQDTELLEILRYLEWSHGPSNWRVCPICRRSKADGHAADCCMRRALAGTSPPASHDQLVEIENLADTALFALDGVNYKLPAVEAVKKLTDRILAGVRMRDIKAESLVEQVEKAKILNYLENCARVSQPVLAWHFRNAKTEIGRGAHLEDNFTFSLPPYGVVKEQEAAEATVREALDDIVEKKLYRTPMSIANERDIKAANPVYPLISPETEKLMAERTMANLREGAQDFRAPEFETEKLRIKKIRERAVADLRGEMQAAPWFAGLSMEEVHAQILLGKAPGSGQPGAAISVPEGFLNWLTDAHRQPGPEKAEEPRFKPLGVGGPGVWEARRRRQEASDLRIKVADEVERLAKILADPHPGLATWNEACERSYQRLRELFHGSSEEPHGE